MTEKRKRNRRKYRLIDPWRDREQAVVRLLEARELGLSLRQAAELAGLHLATVCRWQIRSRILHEALRQADRLARLVRRLARKYDRRPAVLWSKDCPVCEAALQVRRAYGMYAFWRCSRWPRCPFKSWRPRALGDCQRCGGIRHWSYSRKSVACACCGMRVFVNPPGCEQPNTSACPLPAIAHLNSLVSAEPFGRAAAM